MKVKAYIHSLKDHENDRHILGEAEIIRCIGDNLYLAEYKGVRCTAIFNPFAGRYFVDDVYGVQEAALPNLKSPFRKRPFLERISRGKETPPKPVG